jgi:nucleoid-associated protein YgaU
MGQQLKILLAVIAILIVAGLAGIGVYYDLHPPVSPEVAEKQDKQSTGTPAEPQKSAELPAGEAAAPSFDIVRVEPSGDVVAAGQASAGAKVELLLGGDAIAKADANESGEWALVFDKPLDPGSYDLGLRATGPDGKGDWIEGDRVTVVIEGSGKTPLVAVARPGQPTEVLQKPEEAAVAEAPAAKTQTDQQPAAEQGAAQQPEPQVAEATPQAAAGQPSSQQPAAEQATAAQPTGEQAEQSATQEQAAAAVQQPPAQQPPAQQPASQDQAAPTASVAIDTVEVEDPGRLMLGGTADAGAAVRIYLNNERLADADVSQDGHWSISTERPMPPGRYAVRVDVVGADGSVKGRAEVKFDRVQLVAEGEQPAAGNPSAQASAEGSAGVPSGEGGEVKIVSRTSGSGATEGGASVGEGAGASVVVISHGDNLWRIARKIYGHGVRHTVIYEANRKQIRNPNLIYPGQVFTIPVFEDDSKSKG